MRQKNCDKKASKAGKKRYWSGGCLLIIFFNNLPSRIRFTLCPDENTESQCDKVAILLSRKYFEMKRFWSWSEFSHTAVSLKWQPDLHKRCETGPSYAGWYGCCGLKNSIQYNPLQYFLPKETNPNECEAKCYQTIIPLPRKQFGIMRCVCYSMWKI